MVSGVRAALRMGQNYYIRELLAHGLDVRHGKFLVHLAPPVPADHLIIQLTPRLSVGEGAGVRAGVGEGRKDDMLAALNGHVLCQVFVWQEDDRVRLE